MVDQMDALTTAIEEMHSAAKQLDDYSKMLGKMEAIRGWSEEVQAV